MAVDFADLVHRQDVRVIQARRRYRLALETLSRQRIDVAAKHLDRDWPVEPRITGAIHLPDTPFPDQGFDAVGSNGGAGRDVHGGLRASLYASCARAPERVISTDSFVMVMPEPMKRRTAQG